jgi:hypothetical protein
MIDFLLSRGTAVPTALAVPSQDSVVWSGVTSFFPKSALETKLLVWPFTHVVARLAMWQAVFGILIFKVGIAADPLQRYRNAEFGYQHEGPWQFMDVLVQARASTCCILEKLLIRSMGTIRGCFGCYNEKPGGEGVQNDSDHDCFVYLTIAEAGHGRDLAREAKRRRLDER